MFFYSINQAIPDDFSFWNPLLLSGKVFSAVYSLFIPSSFPFLAKRYVANTKIITTTAPPTDKPMIKPKFDFFFASYSELDPPSTSSSS